MTDTLVLRTAIGNYGHTGSLKDGSVGSDRLRLEQIAVEPITDAFRRMVRSLEFDFSEIALTTHALAHAFDKPITALPIVLLRDFHHGALVCRAGSDLRGPADLVGRKVGVRAYSQTTGVWVRGILQTEYGLDPDSVTWVIFEDAHVLEYQDPPNVVRAGPGKNLRSMLLEGEVDAAIGVSGVDPQQLRTVIPDAPRAAAAWYHKTGVYPVNHVVCLKNEVLAEQPWLGGELLKLFAASRDRYLERLRSDGPSSPGDQSVARRAAIVGDEPLPYGVAKNRKGIELLLEFAAQQKLTPRTYGVEELFDTSLLAS